MHTRIETAGIARPTALLPARLLPARLLPARLLPAALLLAALLLGWSGAPALAAKGDTRAGLFVGTTRFVAGGDTTFGTQFGFFYGFEIIDDLLWDFGASFASTDGTATDDAGVEHDISATTSEYRTGLTAFFNTGPGSNVIPYAGGGVSVLQYEIDYDYPGSEIGKTSGSGPGAFGLVGVEFRLTRRMTFIPQFGVQAHRIETEAGEDESILSTGFLISLRIGV